MSREAEPVDVSQNPELLSFAQEIKRSGTSRLLCAGGEELVRVSPIRTTRRTLKGKRTSADDPVWQIVGMGHSEGGPSNVSEHVDEFLAEWEVSQNRP